MMIFVCYKMMVINILFTFGSEQPGQGLLQLLISSSCFPNSLDQIRTPLNVVLCRYEVYFTTFPSCIVLMYYKVSISGQYKGDILNSDEPINSYSNATNKP